jgi:transcriptional regulator with XRE-family HTH domain
MTILEVNRPLAIKIKEKRLERGWTLEKLAQSVGTSKGYIWQIENTRVVNPSVFLIGRIARELHCTVDYLIDIEKVTMSPDDRFLTLFWRYGKLNEMSKEIISKLIDLLEETFKEKGRR